MLRAHDLRCFPEVELAPGPHRNWLIGPNGAGKTTLLEAIYTLSHGHSFRPGNREAMIRRGTDGYDIYAEVCRDSGGQHRVGFARGTADWQIHIDGKAQTGLLPLLECCAVVCFEPGSHGLINGAAEKRRGFLDWGVFHMEHDSLVLWRAYRRAIRQRNALIRRRCQDDKQFEPWEMELGRLAFQIERGRRGYWDALLPHVTRTANELLPELGAPRLRYQSGWDLDADLAEQLARCRENDILRGYTRLGPQRANWELIFEHAPAREYLSRGQNKLAALICVLAQSSLFAEHAGEWPILCLDDLSSELDHAHLQVIIERLTREPAQVWITAVHPPNDRLLAEAMMFHVERGVIRPA